MPRETVVIDTVGFIRKLPHHLVASFRSTMEEAVAADLVLHVIDSSHPQFEDQRAVGEEVLRELGVVMDRVIEVYNKADRTDMFELRRKNAASISALTGRNIERLIDIIRERELENGEVIQLEIPHNDARVIAKLHDVAEVYEQTRHRPGHGDHGVGSARPAASFRSVRGRGLKSGQGELMREHRRVVTVATLRRDRADVSFRSRFRNVSSRGTRPAVNRRDQLERAYHDDRRTPALMKIRPAELRDRGRILEILIATARFTDVEVRDAMELVDKANDDPNQGEYLVYVLEEPRQRTEANGAGLRLLRADAAHRRRFRSLLDRRRSEAAGPGNRTTPAAFRRE